MSSADPDIRKAIETHRQKTINSNHQINLLNSQIDALNIKHRRTELVENELNLLQNNPVIYKSYGRMFIKKDKSYVISSIMDDRNVIAENIELLKKNKDAITKGLSASKDALRELLSSKQT